MTGIHCMLEIVSNRNSTERPMRQNTVLGWCRHRGQKNLISDRGAEVATIDIDVPGV
jgi:hypothetical protein